MKIIHIIPSLSRGGAERFVVDLCNELSNDHDVTLISLFDNSLDSFVGEVSKNVKYISLQKRSGFDVKVLFKLNFILNSISNCIVNSHINALEYVIPTVFFSRNKTPIFHTLHSVAQKEAANKYVIKLRRFLFKNKVTPISISSGVSTSFFDVYRLHGRDKLIVNGRPKLLANLERVYEIRTKYLGTKEGKLFVNVGRITSLKNQYALLKAFERFNKESNHIHSLIILGDVQDDVLYNQMSEYISTNNIDAYFLGGKSNVMDYLAASDAFCLVSLYEGMPISIIEAFCMGCIPLCTPVGGIVDMIEDKVTGYLAQGVSIDDLYENFWNFSNDNNHELIRKNIRQTFVDLYDIGITANNYLKEYRSVNRR